MENQLSIIIPCYNVAEYLPSTLDSILLRQSFLSLEVILIDDGSTDKTLDVIKMYKEHHSDVIRYFSIDNSGVSFARNFGLKQATGEYILFIDGDDMLFDQILPQWMENIYQNQLDVSFVGYEERYWGDDNGFKENRNYLEGVYTGEEILIKKLKKQIWICPGNAIYRTEIIRKNNLEYNVSCRYGEDAEFIGKCLFCAARGGSLNKKGLISITRNSSALSTVSFEKYKDAIKAFKNLHEYVMGISASSALKNALEFDYLNLYLGIVKILFSHSDKYSKVLLNKLSELESPSWNLAVGFKKRTEIIMYRLFPYLYFHVIHLYYLLTQNRWKQTTK